MPRPAFSEIKSYEEFSKYYWYREELQKLCRSLGIEANGMKAELNYNISEYFKGNLIRPEKTYIEKANKINASKHQTNQRPSNTTSVLTLQTSLIECSFCFSQRFRDFFSDQTGIKNFKFNVDMVATVRKVKETKDTSFTLEDLLDIYYNKTTYAKYNKISLQWNKFVQDFCTDPSTAQFSDKLKTAAKLWKIVRESTREKIYKPELLELLNEK